MCSAPSMVLVGNINIDDSSLPQKLAGEEERRRCVGHLSLSLLSPPTNHTGRETRMEMNENEQVDTTTPERSKAPLPSLGTKAMHCTTHRVRLSISRIVCDSFNDRRITHWLLKPGERTQKKILFLFM